MEPGSSTKRVLLAKGMWIDPETIQTAFDEALGWHLTVVHRLDQAFELLKGGAYDLVIIDVSLTGQRYNGFRLIRDIRCELNQTVPIIAVNNMVSKKVEEVALYFGAEIYLPLPSELNKIVDTARELVSRSERADG